MDKNQRYAGVDLFRGIAAFAVIAIHAEHQASLPGSLAEKFMQFSQFAVPFFLATSFYLAANSLYLKGTEYPLKSRLTRLAIPYAIWSLVYLLKSFVLTKPNQAGALFQDPIALVFFGGAAYHLYFLPILLAGTVLVKGTEYLIKNQIKIQFLIVLLSLSLLLYNISLVSGDAYELSTATAFRKFLSSTFPDGNFNPWLRFILVELSWMIRCTPYILMAMILNHPTIRKYLSSFNLISTIILFSIFIIINSFGGLFLPDAVYEISRGYLALFFAIALSFQLKENAILKNLSVCSFGIYLVHLGVLHGFQSLAKRVYSGFEALPVSLISMLIISTLSFIVSWGITYLLTRKKSISRLMFGA